MWLTCGESGVEDSVAGGRVLYVLEDGADGLPARAPCARCLKFVEFVVTSCAIDSSQMHPQMSTQYVCTSTLHGYNSYTRKKIRAICASITICITVLASYNKLPAPASDSAASPSILWASSCTHGGSAMGSSSLGHRAR